MNRFVEKALSLRSHVHKFRETHRGAVMAFDEYFECLKRAYDRESRLLLLITFPDPSVQLQEGRTCSDAEFQAVKMFLATLVQAEPQADAAMRPGDPRQETEPASDDFTTHIPTDGPDGVSAADQIDP
jgi:hypothetical protein